MDYDGANPRKITGHHSTSMSPAWSPDGASLAYTSFFNGPPSLYLADLASGRKRPVVTSGTLNTSPSFSPDGRHIAFARSLEGNVEIFIADTDGGNLRRLTKPKFVVGVDVTTALGHHLKRKRSYRLCGPVRAGKHRHHKHHA